MAVDNNPIVLAYNMVKNVLFTNLTDVNASRGGANYVFPGFTEKKNALYPYLVIDFDSIRFDEVGAGRFFETTYSSGSATQDTYGHWAYVQFTVVCVVKREDAHSVTMLNQASAYNIKNSALAFYMTNQIEKAINKNRNTFYSSDMDVQIGDYTNPYDDGTSEFKSEIPVTVIVPSVWGDEYEAGDLIADYELSMTAAYE